jgi:tRNA A37 threonylcarbamoyladenosine biosynthesis protein TsaE
LYGQCVCVIEWAEKGLAILPDDHLLIKINYVSDTERSFEIEPKGERYVRLLEDVKKSVTTKVKE